MATDAAEMMQRVQKAARQLAHLIGDAYAATADPLAAGELMRAWNRMDYVRADLADAARRVTTTTGPTTAEGK